MGSCPSTHDMNVTNIVTFMSSTLERLGALADAHGGYFTTAEAGEAGISRRALSHHASTGTIERVEHGIYRLAVYPSRRFEDYIVTTLWAGGGAVISHESGLVVYDLSDAMPGKVHVTVPWRFRGKRRGVIVRRAPVAEDERTIIDDVPVTSVERTLKDVAASSDPSIVRQAVSEALDRGLTTRRRLEEAVAGEPIEHLILGDAGA